MNFTELDACVRSLRSEMIAFTSELVAIASENPPGHACPECVRAIESQLRALDLPCETVKYRPAKNSRDDSGAAVVLSSVGNGRRTLYFSGHYDVVPVTTPGQCTPVMKGKTLFGRGSADMKSGLRDGVKFDVEVIQEGRLSGSSETAPLARALSTHVRAITGNAPKFEMCPGLLSALSSVAFVATFQRGTEWAATGAVTQKVPADFPTADAVRVRANLAAMEPPPAPVALPKP